MSAMLASVNSLPEALLVQGFAADIIDLKQPEQGALGALATELVAQIVQALAPETTVSATIGDMAMQPQTVFDAVQAMAATGVDFVKIGLFPEGDTLATIQRLAVITQQGTALIAVLFADAKPDFAILAALGPAGYRGAMRLVEKILNAIKIVYDEAFEKLVAFTKSVCSEMEKILNAVIVSLDSIMEFLQKSRVRGIWSLFPM